MEKSEKLIEKRLQLKMMPQLRFGNPNVRVGNTYEIIDIEGSNFWILDDDNEEVSLGSCRFTLPQ